MYSDKRHKFISTRPSSSGYLFCEIRVNGEPKTLFIHKMVAETFCENLNPDENTTVDHIDGDNQHNHYTNLEHVTPLENNMRHHARRLNQYKYSKRRLRTNGTNKVKKSYSKEELIHAITLMANGTPASEVSDLTGIHYKTLRNIAIGESHKDLTEGITFPDNVVTRLGNVSKRVPDELVNKIWELRENNPKILASEIADILGIERKTVLLVYAYRRNPDEDKISSENSNSTNNKCKIKI